MTTLMNHQEIMGLRKSMSFLCVITLLLIQPPPALGSTGINGVNLLTVGICATVFTIHGYKCEEYDVTTDDGYILSVQRLPVGLTGGRGRNRQPVLLQHGILVDGMAWMLNTPEQSLATILADKGFDVWIANTRGTRFSRRHVSLDPGKPEFWDWTWDDLVAHDLPTVISFVYQQTGQKLHYVGHSLGTLIAMASFSEGKLTDMVKSAAMLSPIAYLSHMNTAAGVLMANVFLGEITRLFGLAEFNPKGKLVTKLLEGLCADPEVNCYDLLSVFTGKNCCLNASSMNFALRNEPQSTSTKTMVHLSQIVRHGILAKYDYGNPISNMEHYGKPKPPIYSISNIPRNFPLFLGHGGQDAIADARDVTTLLDALKSHKEDKLSVEYVAEYAHADFIMGVTAKDVVYDKIVKFFKENQ